MYLYAIKNRISIDRFIGILSAIYIDLIRHSVKSSWGNFNPNKVIFSIISSSIDNSTFDNSWKSFKGEFNRMSQYSTLRIIFKDTNDKCEDYCEYTRNSIVMLNYEILAYLFFKGLYKNIKDYIGTVGMGWNRSNYITIPDTMDGIVEHIFDEDNSPFGFGKDIDFTEYAKDTEYKFCILLINICIIKNKINKYNAEIQLSKKSKKDKKTWIDMTKKEIARDTDIKFVNINKIIPLWDNPEYSRWFENFFANMELMTIFGFIDDIENYKIFASEQLNIIKKLSLKQNRKKVK